MDSINMIISALVAGAISGTQSVASLAIKDTYQSLKELLMQKFRDQPDANLIISKHAEKPDVWEEPLREVLTQHAIDKDAEIVALARQVLTQASAQTTKSGKFNVNVQGDVNGFVQGDHTNVTMNLSKSRPGNKKKK